MAKIKKEDQSTTAFKKGQVTIEGVNFNDAHARSLKTIPAAEGKPELSPEDQFLAENAHQYESLSQEDRTSLLKKAFAACLAAD